MLSNSDEDCLLSVFGKTVRQSIQHRRENIFYISPQTVIQFFFYIHFVTIFRTLMYFFTSLDTKLTTNDQNAHFSKLTIF